MARIGRAAGTLVIAITTVVLPMAQEAGLLLEVKHMKTQMCVCQFNRAPYN